MNNRNCIIGTMKSTDYRTSNGQDTFVNRTAERIEYIDLMNFRCIFLVLAVLALFPHRGISQKRNQLDSLWAAFRDPKNNDSLHVNAIHNITIRLSHADPDSGLAVTKVYAQYLNERHLPESYSSLYNARGTCYLNKGNLDSALSNFEKSLYFRRVYHDKKGEASALNNIGIVYYQRADYYRCLEYYQQSLSIKDSLRDYTGVASSYSNIGMINEIEGNSDKALSYYRKSLHLRDSLKDDRGMGDSYLKIGGVLLGQSQFDSAIFYVHLGIVHSTLAGDARTATTGVSNLGTVFEQAGRPDSALYYYQLALLQHRMMHNDEGVATAQKDVGDFFLKQNRFSDAIRYCDSSFLVSSALGFPKLEMGSCDCLAKAYDKTNQPVRALYYLKRADSLRDILNNVDNAKELNRKSLQYEYAMDKLSDSLRIQKENELKDLQRDEEVREQKLYTGAGIGGFVIMVVLAVVLYRGYRQKRDLNLQLEKKNLQIEEKQKAVLDSITYAKRLQEAILPQRESVTRYLPENFILYKPKDIVAGDFYWMEHVNGTTFIAAADCTGHGVPGAMVSVVCSTALNRSVLEFGLTDPGEILDRTRELVLETFSKSDKDVYDGMDISFAAVSVHGVKWAGAHNPLWIVHDGALTEIAADKQSIGKEEDPRPFKTVNVPLKPGSRIYLLTDGFADQFGGPQGKKFKYKQLAQLLTSTSTLPIQQQYRAVDLAFENWRGLLEQVDDVCLIGIELS